MAASCSAVGIWIPRSAKALATYSAAPSAGASGLLAAKVAATISAYSL